MEKTIKELRNTKNQILQTYKINESLKEEDKSWIENNLLSYNYDKNFVEDIIKLIVVEDKRFGKKFRTFNARMKSGYSYNLNLEYCFQKIRDESFDSQKFKIEKAFRTAIENQILEFKKKQNKHEQDKDVDHVTPFKKLLQNFLQQQNLEEEQVEIKYDSQDKRYRLKNEQLEKDFKDFHEKNAELELKKPEENLTKVKLDYQLIE